VSLVVLLATHCGIGTSIILISKELNLREKKNNISLENLSTQCVDDIEDSLYFLFGIIAFWSIYSRHAKFNIFNNDIWDEPEVIKTSRQSIDVKSSFCFKFTFFDASFWMTFILLFVSYSISHFYPMREGSIDALIIINGIWLIITLLAIYIFNALYFMCCKKFAKRFTELSLTIKKMREEKVKPDIESLDSIEFWYNFNAQRVENFDYVFNITFAGRVILLFTNVVVTMRKLVIGNQKVGTVVLFYIDAVLMMCLFYFLIKSAVNVNEESRKIGEQFHKYILSFKLKDRSPEFDRQVNNYLIHLYGCQIIL